MKRMLLGPLIVLGSYAVTNGQNSNLVTNGAFNGSPAFTAWQIQELDRSTASQLVGGNPGGFIWLNQLVSGATDPSIQQEINGLIIGQQYIISGEYRAGSDAATQCSCPGTPVLALDLDGRELIVFEMPKTHGQWIKFTKVFTATSTSHQIRFRAEINETDGDVDLDNISILPRLADWFLLKKTVENGGGD